jgi:hypothetical protein
VDVSAVDSDMLRQLEQFGKAPETRTRRVLPSIPGGSGPSPVGSSAALADLNPLSSARSSVELAAPPKVCVCIYMYIYICVFVCVCCSLSSQRSVPLVHTAYSLRPLAGVPGQDAGGQVWKLLLCPRTSARRHTCPVCRRACRACPARCCASPGRHCSRHCDTVGRGPRSACRVKQRSDRRCCCCRCLRFLCHVCGQHGLLDALWSAGGSDIRAQAHYHCGCYRPCCDRFQRPLGDPHRGIASRAGLECGPRHCTGRLGAAAGCTRSRCSCRRRLA